MKKQFVTLALIMVLIFICVDSYSQCSICTRTAQQMGEKPAKGLNSGIAYLMLTPFAIAGFVGYRWWKSNRD
jgi:hypothetical protein